MTIIDKPEDHPGAIKIGYNLLGFINLKKGHYVFWQHYYFPRKFKWGEQDKILNILDRPIKVSAGPVS